MDNIFIEYRDPLFSIISIFVIVFIVSLISFFSSIRRQNKNKQIFDSMFSRLSFSSSEHTKTKNNYVHYYIKNIISYKNMLDICSNLIYQKKDNEAISLYLMILKNTSKKNRQLEIMQKLAKIYFNCGFLQRSCDICLEILRRKANNIEVLKQLLMVCFKLNNFSLLRDVLQTLKELKIDTYNATLLYKTLKTIKSDKTINKKTNKLLNLCSKDKKVSRIVVEFLLQNNQKAFWNNLNLFDLEQCIDILWLQVVDKKNEKYIMGNSFLKYLYYHKTYFDNKNYNNFEYKTNNKQEKYKTYFEIDILNYTKSQNANFNLDVSFSYFCNNCKKNHYSSDFVCSHCNSIFNSRLDMKLTQKLI